MSSARREWAPIECMPRFSFYMTRRVSTLRSAIELKAVFDQIQAAEKNGNLGPEERKKLEEQAAEKGLQALFKVLEHFPLLDRERSHKSLHPGYEAGDRSGSARDMRTGTLR